MSRKPALVDLELALDAMHEAVLIVDGSMRIRFANVAVRSLFRGTDLLRVRCHDVIHGTDGRPDTCPFVTDPGRRGHFCDALQVEVGARWYDARHYPIMDGGRPTEYTVLVLNDITLKRDAENALRRKTELLRAYALELAKSEEMERRRVAAEIHDRLGQKLAVCRMSVALAKGQAGSDMLPVLQDLQGQIDSVIAEARSMMRGLSPAALNDMGLKAAIESLAADMERQSLDLKVTGPSRDRLSLEVRLALFKAVQECLENVLEHAIATSASVRITAHADAMEVVVTDNGVGFDASSPRTPAKNGKGMGLHGIGERLEALGGRLLIDSKKGKGTKVRMTVPTGPSDAAGSR